MIDVLQIEDFLDAGTLTQVLDGLSRCSGAPATVLSGEAGGVVYQAARRSTRLPTPDDVRELLTRRFLAVKPRLESHFGLQLGDCEEPQFLRYEEGDYFVAHQDGNTPLIFDRSRFRRVSVVVVLSAHGPVPTHQTYGGGGLVFHGSRSESDLRVPVTPPAGTLVAFRSETTHEVTPVTHGERYTIVTWFLAAEGSQA